MAAVVWISEEEDYEAYETFYLGTFSGLLDDGTYAAEEFHGYSLEHALAWGRERAEKVYIMVGERGVDDYIKAADAARETGGGFTAYVPVYSFELTAEASTREAAVASAIARCGPLPVGWRASGEARPER